MTSKPLPVRTRAPEAEIRATGWKEPYLMSRGLLPGLVKQCVNAALGRGMRPEQGAQATAGEGFDDEQVRGGRVGVERDGLRGGLEFLKRADEPGRRARERRAAG